MNINRKFRLTILSFAVVLSILSVSLITYAWLTYSWNSNKFDHGFTTSETLLPELTVWRYYSDTEKGSGEGEWEVINNEYLVEEVSKTEATNGFSIDIKSLHLGKLDNLIAKTDDNDIYFRFKFSKTEHGTTSLIPTIDYSDDGIEVFRFVIEDSIEQHFTPLKEDKKDNITEDDVTSTYAKIDEINTEIGFLNMQYCLTYSEAAPGTTEFDDLTFKDPEDVDLEHEDALKVGTDIGELLTEDFINENSSDSYYLYLKITPSLFAFGEATNYLSKYMPCILIFNLIIKLEVY